MEVKGTDGELFEIKPDVITNEDNMPDDDSDMKISLEPDNEELPVIEDIFREDFEEIEREDAEEEMFNCIGSSITEQVESDIETMQILQENRLDEEAEKEYQNEISIKLPWYKHIKWWGYTAAGFIILLAAVLIWFGNTDSKQGVLLKIGSIYAFEKMNFQPVTKVEHQSPVDEVEDEIPEDVVQLPSDVVNVDLPLIVGIPEEEEKKVINILLLGEETIDSGGYRGRTDLMMIATMNLEQKTLKLTSLMRDVLVAIPGYSDNRLNAAYAIGGVELLNETIKTNFGISVDNYMLVNFDSFEKIIDSIGGVNIELTAKEADYLNKTNYISNELYRTVVAGMNHMNGNQALGYCRIRHVPNATNEYSDFGRTSRQRTLLNSVFTSINTLDSLKLLKTVNDCLKYVTTDLTAENIEEYLNQLLSIGLDKSIQNLRIPINDTYANVYIRDMLVTKIDLKLNTKALHEFIYGVYDETEDNEEQKQE